jgi:hypothetical protein
MRQTVRYGPSPGQATQKAERVSCEVFEKLRFVNVAEWKSGKALAEARANPELQASVQRLVNDPSCM